MTKFEEDMIPYENWVKDKLSNVVPAMETITPDMCAALIAQYERERTASIEALSKKIDELTIKVYSGQSVEETDLQLTLINSKLKKMI